MSQRHPCPVCGGYGGWSRYDYRPIPRPATDDAAHRTWVRCMYCRGTGVQPQLEPLVSR